MSRWAPLGLGRGAARLDLVRVVAVAAIEVREPHPPAAVLVLPDMAELVDDQVVRDLGERALDRGSADRPRSRGSGGSRGCGTATACGGSARGRSAPARSRSRAGRVAPWRAGSPRSPRPCGPPGRSYLLVLAGSGVGDACLLVLAGGSLGDLVAARRGGTAGGRAPAGRACAGRLLVRLRRGLALRRALGLRRLLGRAALGRLRGRLALGRLGGRRLRAAGRRPLGGGSVSAVADFGPPGLPGSAAPTVAGPPEVFAGAPDARSRRRFSAADTADLPRLSALSRICLAFMAMRTIFPARARAKPGRTGVRAKR